MAQTSLNSTGVASSAALSLQSNGTTEAIGISTGQVATLAQNPILTSGTVNGLAFLNASKVLTTGTALTFDGTNISTALGGSYYSANANYGFGTPDSAGLQIFTASGDSIRLGTRATGTFTERMRLDSSGNLGLGVTPSAWVGYKVMQAGIASFAGGSSGAYLIQDNAFTDNSGAGWKYINSGYAAAQYYAASGAHVWRTAASGTAGNAITFTQAMTLDASGNLGIGTTSPPSRLSVAGEFGTSTTAVTVHNNSAASASNIARIDFRLNNTFNGNERCAAILGLNPNAAGNNGGALVFSVSSDGTSTTPTERARIDSSGNLLVGGTSGGSGNSFTVNTNSGSGLYTQISHPNGTGSGVAYEIFYYNGANIGSITQSGTTAVLYNTTSDQRLKENIQDAAPASALIDSLQVRQYDWKSDGSHQRYGFVAQELVTVAPEAVHQPVDPDEMMAVDYSKLVPMLVKEIQSLRKRLAAAGI